MPSENPTQRTQHEMIMIHNNFIRNLENLKVFVNNLSPVAIRQDERIIKNLTDAFEKLKKICGISESTLTKGAPANLKLTPIKIRQLSSLLRKLRATKSLSQITLPNIKLLYKSSFVLLISHFDFLIWDLVHYFHRKYPENLSEKELSLTFNELKQFDNISDALDHVINKEVEKVLYGNFAEQKKYFKNYIKIDLKEEIIHWDRINEAIERRNIIVHNNGIINKRYLKNADLSTIPCETKQELKEGEQLSITQDYLNSIFDEIFIAGIILIQSCWRKWDRDFLDTADTTLIKTIYEALAEEKWHIAERLGFFAKECETYNERNRLYLAFNYCQSLKWQNKDEQLSKELELFDVSSFRPIYLLAYYALKSDMKSFFNHVTEAIVVDNMQVGDFLEWPIFREFRQDPNFLRRIKISFRAAKRKGKPIPEIPKLAESTPPPA